MFNARQVTGLVLQAKIEAFVGICDCCRGYYLRKQTQFGHNFLNPQLVKCLLIYLAKYLSR
jgi:hypothetical protein